MFIRLCSIYIIPFNKGVLINDTNFYPVTAYNVTVLNSCSMECLKKIATVPATAILNQEARSYPFECLPASMFVHLA